jgi:4'-phosphopantetheinyl transferase EntD
MKAAVPTGALPTSDGSPPRDATVDAALERAIAAMAPPEILIAHRVISPDDESALLPGEAATMNRRPLAAQRASAAARIVVRPLLASLGHPRCAVPSGPSGAPQWPDGIVGSLAHDDEVAVAAVARRSLVGAVGIDVEPATVLPSDLVDLVATARERLALADDPTRGRLLFAAKEAVFKAAHPLDGIFLEFHDIEVDLATRTARTRNGHGLRLRYCLAPRIVVLALA